MDVNDIDDGVESRLEDHVEAALAHLGGLCTVDAMPATQTLTQTRQLDVTRRRLGRIGAIATQNTSTDPSPAPI
jgi:predicted naringenin-chalcone synthase